MQKVQAHDDETLGSGSSAAGTHALDNETDTFGHEIMQHERDARRIRNATPRDPQPVLKTRPRPRISDLVARREREEELASEQQQHVRTHSTGSNDSNPPLNVPRDWGTRAKSHRGWMRKIRESSEGNVNVGRRGLLTPEEEADARPRTSYANDNVWSQGDEHAISMENTPPSMRRKRPNSQPPTLRDANATLRQIIDSEDQGFSQLSLLASTPAAITSTNRSNEMSRHTMDRLEQWNAANSRQDFLSERSPNRNTRHLRDRETDVHSNETRAITQASDSERPTTTSLAEARAARMARRSALIGNKENLPVKDTYSTSYKASETVTISDRTARAVTFKQQQRPSQTRSGSLHLLQRLATSMSPSPGASSSDAARPNGDDAAPGEQEYVSRQHRTEEGPAKSDQSTVKRPWRNRSSARQEGEERLRPDHTGAGKGPRIEELDSNETPMPKDRSLDEKTPVVTGAWVDTPALPKDTRPTLPSHRSAPTGVSAQPSHDALPEKARIAEPSRAGQSDRPKSALEDIVRDARKDPNGPFGDATIQSLEDIIHPNADPTDTILSSDVGAVAKEEAIERPEDGRPLTQAEKDRREEDLAIEAMNRHLRAARTSIKDADRGLQRVENKWESTSQTEVPQPKTTAPAPKQIVKPGRDRKTACEHCGGSYHSVWSGLWTELRSNFYYYDDSSRLGVRPTWLGILVLLWALWNALENMLCMYYCHPLYAEYMTGFGVNPDAPEYPFVIPTLLFRPFRPIWKPVLQGLEASFTAGFHAVFGGPPERDLEAEYRRWQAAYPQHRVDSAWTSGWGGKLAATTASAAARVTASLVDAVDDMGYGFMQDDEYL